MSADDKRLLMTFIKEYSVHEAQARIDLMGKFGDEVLDVPDQGRVRIRDYLLQGYVNNYLAFKVNS
jgi:hypothetical protein